MAYKIGLVGLTNTGKSFSRKTLKKGEETFIISPSHKALHIRDSKGSPLKALDVLAPPNINNINEFCTKLMCNKNALAGKLLKAANPFEVRGNHIVMKDIRYLESWINFVDKKMPHIKLLILPDFTHYISEILAQKEFIMRKAGGEAFQRFWELAADALNNFITSIDELRDDLLVVTEYHCEFNEATQMFEIYVPGGKMLKEKFLPDSYYDVLLYTHVMPNEDGIKTSDRYKFVTKRVDKYNARCMDLFEDEYIPNDLQLVVDKVREYVGIN